MATKSRAPGRRRPRKRFGKHFLAPSWAARVVEAIRPARGDAFLEIGPGTGAITLPLAATGLPILAVEIDRDLASDLAGQAPPNVTILAADVLKADVMPLLSGLVPQGPPDASGVAVPERRLHERRVRTGAQPTLTAKPDGNASGRLAPVLPAPRQAG